jgi:hypothetical protein
MIGKFAGQLVASLIFIFLFLFIFTDFEGGLLFLLQPVVMIVPAVASAAVFIKSLLLLMIFPLKK